MIELERVMRNSPIMILVVLLVAFLGSYKPVGAQSFDKSLSAETNEIGQLITDRTPRGALWRAAALPGWGQIYNKQYIKLPFVYAALGGLVYTAITNHQDYILYREAFQYKAYQELVDAGSLEVNPKSSFQSSYMEVEAQFGSISSRPLEAQRNNFRRSRDLSFVGVGLVYSLAMLDAYVSAHLLDFDVGENLSIHVLPTPGGMNLRALVPLESRAKGGSSNR